MSKINFKTLKEFIQIFYHKIIPRFIRARLSPLIHPPKLSKLIVHDKIDTYFQAYIKEITNNKNNNYKNNCLHKAFNKNMVRSDKIDVKWWSDFISLATLPNGLRFKQLNQSLINLDKNELNCEQLNDPKVYHDRKTIWENAVANNDGTHPSIGVADTRLLNRMRCSAVSAVYGAGMHPDRKPWISNPRTVKLSEFEPLNKFKERSQ